MMNSSLRSHYYMNLSEFQGEARVNRRCRHVCKYCWADDHHTCIYSCLLFAFFAKKKTTNNESISQLYFFLPSFIHRPQKKRMKTNLYHSNAFEGQCTIEKNNTNRVQRISFIRSCVLFIRFKECPERI